MQSIRGGEIFGVISFAHIERASIRLHALDRRRHQEIRVGILHAKQSKEAMAAKAALPLFIDTPGALSSW